MNLDKKLAKYARQLDNPKYYPKILDLLDEAERKGYKLDQFNLYDLDHIASEIYSYYEAITTPEEDNRMIHYCNKTWFIISDKNYILYETSSLLYAIIFYIKTYLILFISKIFQFFEQNKLIIVDNVNKDIWLIRGAIKASKFIGCNIFELEEKKILKI